jgi:crotonobetainyl-CoA:carnitine CoA-transferase CaiB-like acyl-CoA transferase
MFEGVRIIELAQYVFVPASSAMLADHGAEVIKVEPLEGDPYRVLKVGDGRETSSANLTMEQNNRGKKSVAINLQTAEGREIFLKLIETADVFLTSLRPQAIRKLKLDVEDLRARNPKLIYVRGNGYGFKGPEAEKAGFDASAFWARGGFATALAAPGADQPARSRPALGDHSGAISVAFGIASALFKRANTGEPSVVETSLLQTAAWILSSDIVVSLAVPNFSIHTLAGNAAAFPLMRTYRTKDDRDIMLMLLSPDPHWPSFTELVGAPEWKDDPRFATSEARRVNGGELGELIAQKISAKTWAEWRPDFDAWDAPWELIRTIQELSKDPQLEANNVIFDVHVQDGTPVQVVAGPVSFNGSPSPANPTRAPLLGEHTNEVLASAGIDAAAFKALKDKAIVG